MTLARGLTASFSRGGKSVRHGLERQAEGMEAVVELATLVIDQVLIGAGANRGVRAQRLAPAADV